MSARILVVDSDRGVLRSLERELRSGGWLPVVTDEPRSAVRWAGDLPLRAALVAEPLGQGSGLALLDELRRVQPACLRLAVAGPEGQEAAEAARDRGAVLDVIRKPVVPAQVRRALESALARARRFEAVAETQRRALRGVEEAMLAECLDGGHVALAVQPVVDLRAPDEPVGWEGLLRTTHPVLSTPDALLRVATETGRAAELGAAVFRLARGRMDEIPRGARLFLNLHPDQLDGPDRLFADLEPLLDVAPRITLEVGERHEPADPDAWERSTTLLRIRGFGLALDDVGAGGDSVSRLAELQPEWIKLDMSLVRHIDSDPSKQRRVGVLAGLGRALQARVVAVGVEDAREARALLRCGVAYAQGYAFGRPTLGRIRKLEVA